MIPVGLIEFFKSPLGLGIAVALAFMIYVQTQRNDAADGAAAECQADFFKQERDKLQTRLDDTVKLADTNKQTADLAEAEQAKMEKERDAAVTDLRTTQNECRRFTDDQRKRVLNLKR